MGLFTFTLKQSMKQYQIHKTTESRENILENFSMSFRPQIPGEPFLKSNQKAFFLTPWEG